MHPLVIKFGGTSLATPARMRLCARRVHAHARSGRPVAVVVSAIGHTTDRILRWVDEVAGAAPSERRAREADRALATGEDLSAALFAAALGALGVPALSLRGAEAGITAEGPFGSARIHAVSPRRLRELLADGVVPVVSGFQAGRADGETVTLGRGGSDTTAVALAAALGPAGCHIVTDVDAVYTADPRLDPAARRCPRLTHQDLVRLAEGGARVVHLEAARLAAALDVPLRVYSYRAPLRRGGGTCIRTPRAALEAGD